MRPPEDAFLRDAVAALQILRNAKVERNEQHAAAWRQEEDDGDKLSAQEAAERRKKIPRISVESDHKHVMVDGDDGKQSTVTVPLAILSDGTWSTQTAPRSASRGFTARDAAGSTDAPGADASANLEEM